MSDGAHSPWTHDPQGLMILRTMKNQYSQNNVHIGKIREEKRLTQEKLAAEAKLHRATLGKLREEEGISDVSLWRK